MRMTTVIDNLGKYKVCLQVLALDNQLDIVRRSGNKGIPK